MIKEDDRLKQIRIAKKSYKQALWDYGLELGNVAAYNLCFCLEQK